MTPENIDNVIVAGVALAFMLTGLAALWIFMYFVERDDD